MYNRGNPYADFSGVTLTYRYLEGSALDSLFARTDSSGNNGVWYLSDRLGSVRHLASPSGSVSDTITYDSFGKILSEVGTGDRFKYTGREWDSEIGEYFYRARYYGPAVGRFLSEDPIAFAAGDSNLYRYVHNNPVGHRDPTGNVSDFTPGPYPGIPSTVQDCLEKFLDDLALCDNVYEYDPAARLACRALAKLQLALCEEQLPPEPIYVPVPAPVPDPVFPPTWPHRLPCRVPSEHVVGGGLILVGGCILIGVALELVPGGQVAGTAAIIVGVGILAGSPSPAYAGGPSGPLPPPGDLVAIHDQ